MYASNEWKAIAMTKPFLNVFANSNWQVLIMQQFALEKDCWHVGLAA